MRLRISPKRMKTARHHYTNNVEQRAFTTIDIADNQAAYSLLRSVTGHRKRGMHDKCLVCNTNKAVYLWLWCNEVYTATCSNPSCFPSPPEDTSN
jgi:hypothetical protein